MDKGLAINIVCNIMLHSVICLLEENSLVYNNLLLLDLYASVGANMGIHVSLCTQCEG